MIFGAQYGTVSDIEVLWTLIALIGAGYSAFNLVEAWRDWKSVIQKQISNGRRAIAKNAVVSEALRLYILLVFAAIGVLSMLVANQVDENALPWKIRLLGIVARWGFITCSVALVIKTYLVRQVRKEVGHKQPKYKI